MHLLYTFICEILDWLTKLSILLSSTFHKLYWRSYLKQTPECNEIYSVLFMITIWKFLSELIGFVIRDIYRFTVPITHLFRNNQHLSSVYNALKTSWRTEKTSCVLFLRFGNTLYYIYVLHLFYFLDILYLLKYVRIHITLMIMDRAISFDIPRYFHYLSVYIYSL